MLLAYAVLGGPEIGYKQAKAGEAQFTNRHKIAVDDYWPAVLEMAEEEHSWLQQRKKYDYLELLESKPWNE